MYSANAAVNRCLREQFEPDGSYSGLRAGMRLRGLQNRLRVILYPNVKKHEVQSSVSSFRRGLSEPARGRRLAKWLSFGSILVFGIRPGFQLQEHDLLLHRRVSSRASCS